MFRASLEFVLPRVWESKGMPKRLLWGRVTKTPGSHEDSDQKVPATETHIRSPRHFHVLTHDTKRQSMICLSVRVVSTHKTTILEQADGSAS